MGRQMPSHQPGGTGNPDRSTIMTTVTKTLEHLEALAFPLVATAAAT
jgi:hypothetical protein